MNLATDPWIPIVRKDGQPDLVSLREAFSDGEDIQDLAVAPHERIALMRLLLAIAHAGFGGPRDPEDWQSCREHISEKAAAHLDQHRLAFQFLGEGALFGQLFSGTVHAPKPDPKDPTWASKLDLALATGNNPTLFDNGATAKRAFKPARLALMLLAYQACSPLIGRGYKGRSPCVEGNMLHTFLRGKSLIETIWLNLLDRASVEATYGSDTWGEPVWLTMPGSPKDQQKIWNATRTYLGRLVPLPRAIAFGADLASIALQNGLEYPAWDGETVEPTATAIVKDDKERRVLRADINKATWRDLPALAAKDRSQGSCGPLAWQRFPENRSCDFWVGALVTDNKAKVVGTVESALALPASANKGFLTRYHGGVAYAERWAIALNRALATYRTTLKDNIERPQARKRADLMRRQAASHFWTAIESSVRDVLVPLADNPPDHLKCGKPFYLDFSQYESGWGPLVRRAAVEAFSLACPQASARQAEAYGAGFRTLHAAAPICDPIN